MSGDLITLVGIVFVSLSPFLSIAPLARAVVFDNLRYRGEIKLFKGSWCCLFCFWQPCKCYSRRFWVRILCWMLLKKKKRERGVTARRWTVVGPRCRSVKNLSSAIVPRHENKTISDKYINIPLRFGLTLTYNIHSFSPRPVRV